MTLEKILREEIGQLVGIVEAVAPVMATAPRSWFCRVMAYFNTLVI